MFRLRSSISAELAEGTQKNVEVQVFGLEGTDLWEFRTLYSGIKYRLLAFYDKDAKALIITTHGFIKKTQKTPSKEIKRAETIRKEYYNQKNIH